MFITIRVASRNGYASPAARGAIGSSTTVPPSRWRSVSYTESDLTSGTRTSGTSAEVSHITKEARSTHTATRRNCVDINDSSQVRPTVASTTTASSVNTKSRTIASIDLTPG